MPTTRTDQLLDYPAVCNWLRQRTGWAPSYPSFWRWVRGRRFGGIRLKAVIIGRRVFIRESDLEQFIEQTTHARLNRAAPGLQRSPTQRRRASQRAAEELARRGA